MLHLGPVDALAINDYARSREAQILQTTLLCTLSSKCSVISAGQDAIHEVVISGEQDVSVGTDVVVCLDQERIAYRISAVITGSRELRSVLPAGERRWPEGSASPSGCFKLAAPSHMFGISLARCFAASFGSQRKGAPLDEASCPFTCLSPSRSGFSCHRRLLNHCLYAVEHSLQYADAAT